MKYGITQGENARTRNDKFIHRFNLINVHFVRVILR